MYEDRFAFILGPLLLLLVATAFAQESPRPAKRYYWDSRPQGCFMTSEAVNTPLCKPPEDWPDLQTSADRVNSLFIEPDRDLLMRAEHELTDSDVTFASGEYRFDVWYQALYNAINYQPARYAKFVDEWLAHEGSDSYAVIAKALVRHGEAWAARGVGYGNTVSELGWRIYFEKLTEADKTLDTASERMKQTGPWHSLKLSIAMERTDAKASQSPIFEAATNAWPFYTRLYRTAMTYSMPRWGGNFDKVDLIARYAMDKTRSVDGSAMYAIAYAGFFAADSEYTLRDSNADWALVKQGFSDAERNPNRRRLLLEQFALLSCQMKDRDEAKRLYALIDSRFPDKPRDGSQTDTCRLFAMQ
jgi:hypothetical protein